MKVLAGLHRAPALLLIAAALQPFANGRWTVPLIAWLAPMVLLAYLRSAPTRRGLALGWALFVAGWAAQWWGIVRLPAPLFALATLASGFTGFLPYVADRWLAPRLHGLRSTLVFPAAQVSIELLLSLFAPSGSWGSLAYTQYGDLPLMQLASITGLYGISFLIAWGAAAANFCFENRHWPPLSARAALIFAATLAAALLYGGARLAQAPDDGRTLRVATISPLYDTASDHDPAGASAAQDFLYARSSEQAAAGAKTILWPEDSFFVRKLDEAVVLERARAFAREQRLYLGIAYGALLDPGSPRYENKMLLITPAGDIAWQYLKNHPVPGREQMLVVRGDGGPAVHESADGRFAGAICYDADFPEFFAGLGAAGVDALYLPADDWRAIDPLHAHMAVFRAIEQGFSLVRPTMNGLSIATNHRGEVLGAMDHWQTQDRVMAVNLPLGPVRTIYSRVGNLFAWLCVAGLLALTVLSKPWIRSRSPKIA